MDLHHRHRSVWFAAFWAFVLFFGWGNPSVYAAPTFTNTPTDYAILGSPYLFDLDAVDAGDPNLTFSLITSPAGSTINATTGVVTWPNPTGTATFTARVCNSANQCVNTTWSVTTKNGPVYLVYSASNMFLWGYQDNARYWIHRISDNSLIEAGTIPVAGRAKFVDLSVYGITSATGHLYIRADKPLSVVSGDSKSTAGGEGTHFYSQNGTYVGKVFVGYTRKDILVYCHTSDTTGTVVPNIRVTDVSDADDSTTLTSANVKFSNPSRDVNGVVSGRYWIWELTTFDDDEFRIEPTNPSSPNNPDCSVAAGVIVGRNDWSMTAPSMTPTDLGRSYGTRFYTHASIETAIFASQADTKVTIRNITNPAGNNNTTFTLNVGGNPSFWSATFFPDVYNGFSQISNGTGFNGEYIEVVSDKPISVYPTAMRAVGSYITNVQLFKRPDNKYEGYCYVNKVAAQGADISIYTKDAQTRVEVRTIGGQKNDTSVNYYIGPWTGGQSPLLPWSGQTYKYAQAPANSINAELVQIIADRYPVLVVCGDISGSTQLYHLTGKESPLDLPPVIAAPPPPSLTAVAGVPYKPNQVVATDPEGGPLLYFLSAAPAGATISPNSGQILWTPSVGEIGQTFTFTVVVVDQEGNTATRTWQVRVVVCNNGDTRACYTGASGCSLLNGVYSCVGECRAGTQTCTGEQWPAACGGQQLPASEVCDGKDNNCDGQIDNNLTAPLCAKQQGVCSGARQICTGATGWRDCTTADYAAHNANYEATETKCDGLDNDCSGQIDNNLTAPLCANQQGVCIGAKQTCGGASGWRACTTADYAAHNANYEAIETKCDGLDNDCNGQVDNNLTAPLCANQQGVCSGAKQTCGGAGGWRACTSADYAAQSPDYEATETKCDGKDNNCDGQIDNNLTAPLCSKQSGVCSGSRQICTGATGWRDCTDADYTAQSPDYEATETKCDGKDNNCDGRIDNNLTAPLCSKQSGVCNGARQSCTGATGWKDCDDAAYTAHNADYQATETKCDGKDNDCNGQIDTGCQCQDGQNQACYTGGSGCVKSGNTYTCKGECKSGTQVCTNGQWGACTGDAIEQTEVCDGKDNDCDGQIDNNLVAPNCANQQGVCSGAKQTCGGASGWRACTSADYAAHSPDYEATETKCDGKDNDCDGRIDNNLTAPLCSKQQGVCSGARQICTGATGWKDCTGADYTAHNANYETTETKCDGRDNDCNGQVDNNLTAPLCSKQSGVCSGSRQTCDGANGWKDCDAASYRNQNADYEAVETKCDGKDNDCNGQVDNNLTAPLCSKQQGVCSGAKQTCAGASGWRDCTNAEYSAHNANYEAVETKCDGQDNDCNGQVDNNLTAPLCSKQQGVCSGAKQTCGGASGWKDCTNAEYSAHNADYEAVETKCDGKDNDCNGQIDNNLTAPLCSKQQGACIGAKQSCTGTGGWKDCDAASYAAQNADYEAVETKCDGKDNDCNGQIDDALVAPNCTKQSGVCNGAKQRCDGASGWKDCSTTDYQNHSTDYQATETKCDGKDNDCNGQIDDGCQCQSGQTQDCYTGNQGCTQTGGSYTCRGTCAKGSQTCDATGKWGACTGDTTEQTEVCDGKDNDCDGQIDNNLNAPLCANQQGVCSGAKQTCDGVNGWKPCGAAEYTAQSADYEAVETKCDGKDNDCNGQVDENLTAPLCSKQQGVCSGAKQRCDGTNGWKDCDAASYSAQSPDYEAIETKCDGKDNDCNGQVDEPTKCTTSTPPQIQGVPEKTASATKSYGYQPSVVDPDANETHRWQGTRLPTGATVDPQTGEVKWTPSAGDAGKEFEFEIEVCDSANLCAKQAWKVRVGTGNQLPQIIGTPKASAEKDKSYTYKPTVRDPDAADTHAWKLDKAPSGATIDPKTGEITWVPSAGDVGKEFEFEVTVCDSAGDCATQSWKVLVVDPNRPPQITTTPPTSASAGLSYSYKAQATDPDADVLTWKLNQKPAGAAIDPKTGEITWTPSAGDDGKEFSWEVEVCDAKGACVQQSWNTRVGAGNQPPSIEGIPSNQAAPRVPYAFEPKVKDADANDKHTWKLNQGPSGATIDPQTGKLNWTPDPSDAGKTVTFEIEVCDDKGSCAKLRWSVKVGGVPNTPPIIDGAPSNDAAQGRPYSYEPKVIDPDVGDTHTWKLNQGPSGATVDPQTGKLNWTPGPNDVGKDFTFEVEVCDSRGACAKRIWKVRVGDKGKPPQMGGTPQTWTNPNQAYQFKPFVVDPDANETYTWKGNTLPPGATVDPNTGEVKWTPGPNDVGKTFDFEIELCDSQGLCTKRRWQVRVLTAPRNNPPEITSTPPTDALTGQAFTYTPAVRDPDTGDTHTWKLKQAPPGATIDPQTGKITWTPTPSEEGKTTTFEVEVCDSGTPPLCNTQTFEATPRQACRVDIDCKNDRICIFGTNSQGRCFVPICTPQTQPCLYQDDLCKEGACLPDPCKGKTCAAGEVCRPSDGTCFKPCAGVQCSADQTCRDGVCGKDPCQTAGLTCKADEICDPTTSTPKCSPNPCNSMSCRFGRTCSVQGRCIEDPCLKVQCPDPTNQRCVLGQCVDIPRCKVDIDCPNMDVCLQGICQPAQCYTSKCPQTQRCVKAVCEPQLCPTPNGTPCSADQFCRPSDNKCVKSCGSVSCAQGQRCIDGACVADPCASASCAVGEVCVAGKCEKSNCTNASVCRHGRVCNPPSNACVDDPCFGITCPASGEICVDGQCVAKGCQFDKECGGTEICVERACIPRSCAATADCAQGELCINGKCMKDPCVGKNCTQDQICRAGDCVATCAGIFCPEKQLCLDGQCKADPCAGVACKSNEICRSGACVPNECVPNSDQCKTGRICEVSRCVDDPCKDLKCPAPSACEKGQCVGGRSCKVDAECPGDSICVNASCVAPGCYTKQDCATTQLCAQAVCKDNPCNTKTCATGEFCDPQSGGCKKSCSSCTSDQRCVDGLCQKDPCSGVTCPSGETCQEGQCAQDACASVASPCRYGRLCEKSRCIDDPCNKVNCGGGTCRAGMCYGADKEVGQEQITENVPDVGVGIVGGGCGCHASNPADTSLFWLCLLLLALLVCFRLRALKG